MIIGIERFLSIADKLVIDMRTKEEYEAGHIIDAINFEILDYKERKKVSILYNEGLNQEAYLLAYEYALDKLPKLFSIIKKHKEKAIIFYCSRGGSRSSIVFEVFKNLQGIDIYKIENGYKSYRQFVNDFFEEALDGYESLTIYDTIGLGTLREELETSESLILDLRSMMEPIENPFVLLKNKENYFNNRMLNYTIFQKMYDSKLMRIVFILPIINRKYDLLHESLYKLIDSGVRYYLSPPIDERVQIIRRTYFKNLSSLEALINFLSNKRKEMSNALVDDIIEALNTKAFNKAIKLILLDYMDPMMDYLIKKNEVKKAMNMKEVNKYLESWSE